MALLPNLTVNLFSSCGVVLPLRREGTSQAIQIEEGTYKEVAYTLVRLDPANVSFSIVDNNSLGSIPEKEKGTLFFNGGFFVYADASAGREALPEGLLVSEGRTLSNMSLNPTLSGVFSVVGGKAFVEDSAAYTAASQYVDFAVQSGPLVIEHGGRGIYSNKGSFYRTIVAIDRKGSAYVVFMKNGIGLYDAQDLLLTKIPGIDMALNLDGGPSTSFRYISPQGKEQQFGSCTECPYLIRVTPKK